MKVRINRISWIFVAFSLLLLPDANAQEAITKLRVVSEMANVRLQPDIGSVIIHQVPQGTSLESTGKEGEWYLVKIQIEEGQEVSGFVHESTVIVTERPPPVKVETPVKKEEVTEPEKEEEEPQIQPIPETPSERQPFESRIDLWFLGGGNYVVGGDINSGAQGFVDFYRDFHSIGEEFDAKPVHLSYLFGGEFSIPIGSNFYLGLGADFYRGERESLIELQETPAVEIRTQPKIQAIPIRLFISYYPVQSFYIKTGIEYYFAKCEYFYRHLEDTAWTQWHGTAKTQGTGILGAIGVDLEMAPWMSFNIEATGRIAKISGFKGSDRSIDSDGVEHIENGTLYFFEARGSAAESYPFLFIRVREPIEDVLISDPRRAIIDFSGVSLKAGFKLRF